MKLTSVYVELHQSISRIVVAYYCKFSHLGSFRELSHWMTGLDQSHKTLIIQFTGLEWEYEIHTID